MGKEETYHYGFGETTGGGSQAKSERRIKEKCYYGYFNFHVIYSFSLCLAKFSLIRLSRGSSL